MASAAAEQTEMKAQATIETATELSQDPQSKVNPEKVEEKLVQQTKEAGGAAYQFDPNASPEAKAAATQSVSENQLRLHYYRTLIRHWIRKPRPVCKTRSLQACRWPPTR